MADGVGPVVPVIYKGNIPEYRSRLESANRQKFVGAGLIILGGLTVAAVLAGSILAAKFGGEHNNVFKMGKQFNVSIPGASVSSTVGAASIAGATVIGLVVVGVGSVLVHNSRKKSEKAKKEFEGQVEEDNRKLMQRNPGTNKKWAGAFAIGAATLLLVGAVAVMVLPKFTNMQAVNHMGPSFTAGHGLHSFTITAGAIGSLSAGVLALGLFGVGGALIHKGRKEAKERAEEEERLIQDERPLTALEIGLIDRLPDHEDRLLAGSRVRPLASPAAGNADRLLLLDSDA